RREAHGRGRWGRDRSGGTRAAGDRVGAGARGSANGGGHGRRNGGGGGMSGGGRLTLVEGGAGEHGITLRAAEAVTRAETYLLAQQDARGYWAAPLEANATMEAEYVFANRILGRHASDTERRLTDRLLALQHADGGWPLYPGGPGHLSITIETYLAL